MHNACAQRASMTLAKQTPQHIVTVDNLFTTSSL